MSNAASNGKSQRKNQAKERHPQPQLKAQETVNPKNPQYRGRKNGPRKTSLYRARKNEEVRAKQELGVDSKPEPAMEVQTYEDYPVVEGVELDQILRQMSPMHDECLGNEFWNQVGLESSRFMTELPMVMRQTIDPMEMMDQE
jgi:hypothetical protein